MFNKKKHWGRVGKGPTHFGRIVVLVAIFFGLIAGSFWATGPAFAAGGKAYIIVGDIDPPWYSTLLRSTMGVVDIYQDMEPVMFEQAAKMMDLGYEVEFIDIAINRDLEKVIKDPNTKAIAFFGHGDENIAGTAATCDGDIIPDEIRTWAQEKLAEKIGPPASWRDLPEAERRKNMELWGDAHFNLEYAYFHACYSLATNELPDVLMADDGQFYGYKEKAYLSDQSVFVDKIRGETVTQKKLVNIWDDIFRNDDYWDNIDWGEYEGISDWQGTDWSGIDIWEETDVTAPQTPDQVSSSSNSGVYPDEPYNGMQITYNISGATLKEPSDPSDPSKSLFYHSYIQSCSLTGKLGTGQLRVSGIADMKSSNSAYVEVYVRVGDNEKSYTSPLIQAASAPFDVSVPIPAGATVGYIDIRMQMSSIYGERGLAINGKFEAEPPAKVEPVEPAPVNEISVFVKGKRVNFDVAPLIENGRTLVPIRKIADALGCTTEWYPPDTVTVDQGDTHIELQINNKTAYINGWPLTMDVPPRIIGNRTLLPLRFLSESMGLGVGWDDKTRVVTID